MSEKKESIKIGSYVIVRTHSAGVFYGKLTERRGQEVLLKSARRLWKWSGASELSQLAVEGVKSPQNCKFPMKTPAVLLLNVIEIQPLSKEALASLEAVPVWKL